MAAVGEGDSRWVVEHREDGRNVNSWHWDQLDVSNKTEGVFESIIIGTKLCEDNDEITDLVVTKIKDWTADVVFTQRKGKVRTIFDLEFVLKFTCKIGGDDAKGTVEVPSLANGEEDDFDVKIKFKGDAGSGALKKKIRPEAFVVLQNAVNLLLETLREQHLGNKPVAGAGSQVSIDAIAEGTVSLDDLQANGGAAAATTAEAAAAPTAMDAVPTGSGSGGGSKSSSRDAARSFKQVVSFHAPIDELFDSFVDPGRIMAYTQSGAEVTAEVGGTFALFGGAVTGSFLEIEAPKSFVQQWRFASWGDDVTSTVSIELEEADHGRTLLTLNHSDIPADDYTRTTEGWEQQFWGRIKGVFGWTYDIKS